MSAWWKIGVAIAPMAKYQQDSEAGKETMKKRRRLLQIGFMVSVCLLLNMIATLATSTTLEEWSRTADLFLTCSTKETWDTRNFGAYGLSNNPQTTPVCNLEEILPTKNQKEKTCTTPCYWDPDVPPNVILRCGVDDDFTMEMFDQYKEGMIADGLITSENLVSCDCPCSSFVEVQPPSVAILTLAHVAQSLVVVIVGLNLGFRKDNLNLWKKIFQKGVPSSLINNKKASGTMEGTSSAANLSEITSTGASKEEK